MTEPSLICAFSVPGSITAMGRPRFVRKTGIAFTPPKSRDYCAVVRDFAKQAMNGTPPFDGACRVRIDARYLWPSSWSAKRRQRELYKASKPDFDNIAKAIADACNRIVFTDDARVADIRVVKVYSEMPGLFVEVWAL